MTLVERIGLALVRPRAALAIAGDRKHAGRSGSDLLVAMIVLVVATQLRALVTAGWLAARVDVTLGLRALVAILTSTLIVDLGFLVVGAAIIFAAAGRRRELGRAFDLACVAVLPLLFVDLAASTVVYAAELAMPRAAMWGLSVASYAWTGVLVALAALRARGVSPAADPSGGRRAGWALAGVALVGLAVQGVWVARHLDLVRPMTQGDPAPEFALPRITGAHELGPRLSLADTRGKVTVIDFWATWCNPCLKALPRLDRLARAHPDVAVIAINIDDAGEAWSIFQESKYAMTLVAGDQQTSDRYGVGPIPHTVVIDREGNVRRVYRGTAADLEREVESLLK